MRHVKVYITGKVHGVGLRYWLKEQALKFGLRGFIRNEPDGTVYIEVEGADSDIARYLELCRAGNGEAQVHHVRTESGGINNYVDFTIKN